jgi:hypothetical protein
MTKLVLFIDLDGTLKTDMDATGPFEVPSMTVQCGNKIYTFGQRPHLHEFLDAVSKKAELILTTAATRNYAKKVLELMNISDYFSRIIAREDFVNGYRFLYSHKYILIDNDAEMADLKMNKLKGLGMSNAEKEIWTVDTFQGNKDDKTLLEILEEVNRVDLTDINAKRG